MEPRTLLDALNVAERLKDTTRHCYTKNGRHNGRFNDNLYVGVTDGTKVVLTELPDF